MFLKLTEEDLTTFESESQADIHAIPTGDLLLRLSAVENAGFPVVGDVSEKLWRLRRLYVEELARRGVNPNVFNRRLRKAFEMQTGTKVDFVEKYDTRKRRRRK